MNDNNEIINYLLWFAGVAGSAGIAAYVYKKQKGDSKPFEERVIETLEKNLEQGYRNGARGVNIIYTLNKIKSQLENTNDQKSIEDRLTAIEQALKHQSSASKKELPINEIIEYKSLGDRWSELEIRKHSFSVLDSNGKITTNQIQIAHNNLFPSGYVWAGKLRKEHVYIVENFGTQAKIVDSMSTETKVDTIPPGDISENMERICQHWNNNLDTYSKANNEIKLKAIAQFHHEFELIHPFLDGNGRLGRVIINEQLSYLFHQTIMFEPDREDYYMAIRLMNLNEDSRFISILKDQLNQNGINF